MQIEIRTEQHHADDGNIQPIHVIGVYFEDGRRETYYAYQQDRLAGDLGEAEASELAAQAGW
jgi:hypothetical protein